LAHHSLGYNQHTQIYFDDIALMEVSFDESVELTNG